MHPTPQLCTPVTQSTRQAPATLHAQWRDANTASSVTVLNAKAPDPASGMSYGTRSEGQTFTGAETQFRCSDSAYSSPPAPS